MPRRRPMRRASALILHHEGEVYLARRHRHRPFFGNFFAFPGGGLDAADDALAEADGGPRTAFDSALVRETVEELGLHLHLRPGAAPIPEAEREQLRRDAGAWARWQEHFDLAALDPPCCRLVTPDFYPLRFDTAFYLVDRSEVAVGQRLRRCAHELAEDAWATPRRWLELWRAGEVLLVPPAVILLEALSAVDLGGGDPAVCREALARAGRRLEEDPLQPIWNVPTARLLPLRTPTLPPARHTNAYLVGGDPAYLVDPASPYPEVQEELGRVLDEETATGKRLSAILLTHHHRDHVGAVDFVRRRFGLPVYAHAETARWLDGRIGVDRLLEDGEELELGTAPDGSAGWRLRAVHTPGHAPGHLCFLDDRYRTLLAGDMVSTLSSILIDPEDGDLALYEQSLRRLIGLEPRVVLPAHGPADGRGADVLREQLEHRGRRTDQVRAALARGLRETDEIVEGIYGDVPPDQRAYAGRSVASILRELARRGEVTLDARGRVTGVR